MKRIAGDIGVEFTYDLINYYFDNRKFHDFMWFTYNYHTLIDEMHYKAKDEDKRERLRKVTRERMIELGIPVGIDEQTQSQEEPQLTLKED